ncbi:MAG TPA: sn-glycerol-3-phosphate ABC transporter ATP-binding protein UgpC [Thermoanaerobaculia bacterium]|nr:sn-glycerol-3-phosphate ABC transporter ATP-binding protein UgpC [Thermoanaerobaculia bacterium]
MAGVTLRGVSKRFGDATVLDRIDLDVVDREFMVLVGPSGCGKSTALRLIAGLEDATEGEIAIGGRSVDGVAPRERNIAMVFQSYALYPHMTIRENLEFGLRMRKTPRAEMDRLVAEAGEILGLVPLFDRLPKQLSGGQRQRVALGRAIVRKPAVFLFDEPLSNLDARLRVQMRAEIKTLQQRLETTTIYVTHDQVEAMTMGTRIAVMKDGRIQQVGPPLDVYDRPVNVFVAGFLGTPPMNLFHARIAADGGSLAANGLRLTLPPGTAATAKTAAGGELIAGIRPEHLSEASDSGGGAAIDAVVDFVEQLGDEGIVHARAGDVALLGKLDAHVAPRAGDRIALHFDPSRLHLFDPGTERRLAD